MLKYDFVEICKVFELSEDSKPSKFLFVDGLSSKIKKTSEENKLFNEVSHDHKTTRPKKSFKSSAESNSFKSFYKNTGGVSIRRVVFRKKQWKNKGDSKKRIGTICMGCTKYFTKKWKKLTSDKMVLETVKGLEILFKRKPVQRKKNIDSASVRRRVSVFEGRNSKLTQEKDNKASASQFSKVFESSLYCPETRWISPSSDEL